MSFRKRNRNVYSNYVDDLSYSQIRLLKTAITASGISEYESIELNELGSGNRQAYIDFHGDDTYTDYALRVIRYGNGANSESRIHHRGTGDFSLYAQEAAEIKLYTSDTHQVSIASDGSVKIGKGLYIGSVAGTTFENDIVMEGGINAGGSTDPGAGEGIFTAGIRVGDDASPTDDDIYAVGDLLAGGGINAGGSTDPGAGEGIFTAGIRVGDDASPTDDDIYAVGDILAGGGVNAGGSTDPVSGEGIFPTGIRVGEDASIDSSGFTGYFESREDGNFVGLKSFMTGSGGYKTGINGYCQGGGTENYGVVGKTVAGGNYGDVVTNYGGWFSAAGATTADYAIFAHAGDVKFNEDFYIVGGMNIGGSEDPGTGQALINSGLRIGAGQSLIFDDDLTVQGGINVGGSTNPGIGEGIFTKGIRVGDDAAPTDDDVYAVGDLLAGGGVNAGGSTDPGAGDGIFVRGVYVGSDTAPIDNDIYADGEIVSKGNTVVSGTLYAGSHAAIAAETVTGYITIKDIDGNDRKVAIVS